MLEIPDSSHYANLKLWTNTVLPQINTRIEAKQADVDELVYNFKPFIEVELQQKDELLTHMTRDEARAWLQLIGFGVSSLEKHCQELQMPAGVGLAKFLGLENFLVRLGQIAQHPPRDSHYTYWLWNEALPLLTFTGDEQELVFQKEVKQSHYLHTASCNALRPICNGEVSFTSKSTVEALQFATDNTQTLLKGFRSFMARIPPDGHRSLEPKFFMMRLRTYLPTYPIQGVTWGGVNAANLAAQMQIDFLTGTVTRTYREVVEKRFQYLTDEDRVELRADMGVSSLKDLLLDQLGLSDEMVEGMKIADLTNWLINQPEAIQSILSAYAQLVKVAGQLTAFHWSLIQNYLVKAADNLSPTERANLAVKPESGTGGASHEQTRIIRDMRRTHPIVGKLIEAWVA
jgi:hypothetical protein